MYRGERMIQRFRQKYRRENTKIMEWGIRKGEREDVRNVMEREREEKKKEKKKQNC